MSERKAQVEWRAGVPVSSRFQDPYFSLQNGLAEARHVFLEGNNLPARLRAGFEIAELGFGTGLNALAVAHLWQHTNTPGGGRFTSFEAYPMDARDAEAALRLFPEIAVLRTECIAQWDVLMAGNPVSLGPIELRVVLGDVARTLPMQPLAVDAWFLDGFAPDRNPAMWTAEVLSAVGAKTRPGGTFATYCAAGHVRRGLGLAGFEVMRTAGFARKRHMTRGWKPRG